MFIELALFCLAGFAICLFFYQVMVRIQASDEAHGLLPPEGEVIPGTDHAFMRVWDFFCMKYGDCWGLPFMWGASLHAMFRSEQIAGEGWYNFCVHAISLVVGALAARIFHWSCTRPGHKGDWAINSQWISVGHYVHLMFLGISTYAGLAGLILWSTHFDAPEFADARFWIGFMWFRGFGFWLITQIMDSVSGHYDRLEPDKVPK